MIRDISIAFGECNIEINMAIIYCNIELFKASNSHIWNFRITELMKMITRERNEVSRN